MPRIKPSPLKNCEQCGKRLERKRYRETLESMHAFLRRKFCDQLCMARHMVKGRVTLAGLRARARKFLGAECQACQTTKRLEVHHIDGNPANNAPTNRITLCGACHTKWHWQHGKRAKRTNPATCSVCSAGGKIRKGLCQAHYQRFKRWGNVFASVPVSRQNSGRVSTGYGLPERAKLSGGGNRNE